MKKTNINNHSPPLLAAPSYSVPSSPTVPENSNINTPAKESESCPLLLAPPEPPVPEQCYPNSETSKSLILLENKGKSGIYM